MHKLKKLQERFKKGELTKAQYLAEAQKLLDDEYIDQSEYDDAKDFDPDADKPIYTQADVDAIIVKKANSMVRKALNDAGVKVEADNKTLLPKVVELVKVGQTTDTTGGGKATDKDLEKLKALEAKVPTLEAKVKDLTVTNAVLVHAAKFNPINPSQVARALRLDYMNLVEVDEETGEIDTKTVEKALKRIKDAEPNLFKAADGGEDDDTNVGAGDGFRSKAPGGSGTGGSGKDKDYAAKKAKALEMLGIPQNKK